VTHGVTSPTEERIYSMPTFGPFGVRNIVRARLSHIMIGVPFWSAFYVFPLSLSSHVQEAGLFRHLKNVSLRAPRFLVSFLLFPTVSFTLLAYRFLLFPDERRFSIEAFFFLFVSFCFSYTFFFSSPCFSSWPVKSSALPQIRDPPVLLSQSLLSLCPYRKQILFLREKRRSIERKISSSFPAGNVGLSWPVDFPSVRFFPHRWMSLLSRRESGLSDYWHFPGIDYPRPSLDFPLKGSFFF